MGMGVRLSYGKDLSGRAMKQNIDPGKRILLLCLLLLGFASSARADASMVLGDILKKTEHNYLQIPAFSAKFHQRTTSSAGSGMVTEASGKLYYQKPRQMRWEYEKPDRQIFVANQQSAWLSVPSERQISLFDSSTFFASPLARTFFDGLTDLKTHFEVTLDPRQSNKAAAVLKLIPKKEDPNIKTITLWIDLDTHRISAVETLDALNSTNRISLESQKSLPFIDPKLFQLEVPPSTVVLDTEGRQMSPADVDKLKLKLAPK